MSENNTSSDWIYTLLTLLTVGVSLVKSWFPKNKKTDTSPFVTKNNSEEFSEDDWKNKTIDEYVDSEELSSLFKPQEEKMKKEYIQDSVNGEQVINVEEMDFDLKKAVIYNEILNRKYE